MSLSESTSTGTSKFQAEASSSTTSNGKGKETDKGKGRETMLQIPPSNTNTSPTSASSIWVLTFNASKWALGTCAGVALPIFPDYEHFKDIETGATGAGISVIQPSSVLSAGVIAP